MTRTQAWRVVAEAFGTPKLKRTEHQQWLTAFGLCEAMVRACPEDEDTKRWPYEQLAKLALGYWTWWYDEPRRPEAVVSAERATFAGLMAAMTQQERDQLVKGL